MGKQKMVLKLSMEEPRKRSKVLKIAVGISGVTSAEIVGDKVVVIGDEVDSVKLTQMLRKKMGPVQLDSVSALDEKKKEEKKEEAANNVQPMAWPSYVTMAPQPYMYAEARDPYYDSSCSIM